MVERIEFSGVGCACERRASVRAHMRHTFTASISSGWVSVWRNDITIKLAARTRAPERMDTVAAWS